MDNGKLAEEVTKEIEHEYFGGRFRLQYTGTVIEMVAASMLNEGSSERFIAAIIGDIISATRQEYGE